MYVIRFDNGSFNFGPGDTNGFEATLAEATRYSSEQVDAKLPELMGVDAIGEVGPDGRLLRLYPHPPAEGFTHWAQQAPQTQ